MAPASVLFSENTARTEGILRWIDRQCYQPHFAVFGPDTPYDQFDLIVPLRIQDLCLLRRDFSELHGLRCLLPELDPLMTAHHKPQFNRFLGLHFGPQLIPKPASPGGFPYIIKRNEDAGGCHAHLVLSPEDEARHGHLWNDPDYFSQAYIPGDVEYTDHVLFDGEILYCSSIEFRMNREHYVRGTRMQPYRNVNIQLIAPKFQTLWHQILTSLNFQGLCCFNYKLIDQQPIIFELNPRFGGSLPRDLNRMLFTLHQRLNAGRSPLPHPTMHPNKFNLDPSNI